MQRGLVSAVAVAALLAAGGAASANSTAVYVRNHTLQSFQVWQTHVEGRWRVAPVGMMHPNTQINWASESSDIVTGTEGWVILASLNGNNTIRFDWDNPLIGSNSYSVQSSPNLNVYRSSGGPGDDALVVYEVWSAVTESRHLPTPASGLGVISGTIRWKTSEGMPAAPQWPDMIWQAVTIHAQVPVQFVSPQAGSGLPTPSTWNGSKGYFDGQQASGTVQCRKAASLPPGYYGFDYSITGLPQTVPVQLAVAIVDTIPWQPDPSNQPPLAMLEPKHVRGVIPLASNEVVLAQSVPTQSGIDFEIVGTWKDGSGAGAGGAPPSDLAALLDRAKSMIVNPNPVLLAFRAPAFVRANTLRLDQVARPTLGSQVQIQRGGLKVPQLQR